MDLKLSINGDLKRKNGNLPYHITGREELIQRMYVLLCVRKGRFIYNRELGSRIREVELSDPDAALKIEAYARKALESIPSAEVTGVSIYGGQVTVMVLADGEDAGIQLRGDT